jgi:hypothetical protein
MADAQIDGSIAANIGKGQGNDLIGMVGRFADIQNAVNQNRLFQGRQAAGAALQQSIDPSTGQVNFDTFNRLIQGNPQIAPYAQEALQASLTARGQNIQNTTGQTALQGAYTANLRKVIAAVPPGPNQPQQVISAIKKGADMGLYPADLAASFVGGQDLSDGTSMSDLVKQATIANGEAAPMEAQFGTSESLKTGGTDQAVNVNRVTGTRTNMSGDAANVQMTLTPESKAARQPVVVGGAPASVPTSALVTPTGEPRADNGLTGPHGEVQTDFSPSAKAAATATGTGLAGMGLNIVQRASRVPDNKAALETLGGLLDTPGLVLGPQSSGWNKLQQLAAQYGLAKPASQPATAAAAKEEATKLAVMIAQNQFQAMGGTGTDAKLESAMHTSPSEFLTKQGNKQIIAMLKGNEDAYQHYAEAWQKWQDAGHGPESLGQFQAQWNKIYDPRVFQSQYMSPTQKAEMLKGMSQAEQDQFKAAYKRAHGLGWIQ